MEFSMPLPQELDKNGILYKQWTEFTQRFESHRKENVFQGYPASSSILLFSAHHNIRDIVSSLQKPEVDFSLLVTILETVENYCLPHFLLLFERFRYFTMGQGQSESIDDFVQILSKQLEICEFGDFKQKTMVNALISSRGHERLKQNFKESDSSNVNLSHEEISSIKCRNEGTSVQEDCIGIQTRQTELKSFPVGVKAERKEDDQFQQSLLPSDEKQQLDQINIRSCQSLGNEKQDGHDKVDFPQSCRARVVVQNKKHYELSRSSSISVQPKLKGFHKFERAKLFECFLCTKTFAGTKCLQKHIMSKHGNVEKLLCAHCNASFTDLSEYIGHCKGHSSKRGVEISNMTAALKQKDNSETERFHNDAKFSEEALFTQNSASTQSKVSNFLCWKCGDLLPDLQAYRKHCETYVVKTKFSCDMCQKKYHSITRLFGHLRNHLSPRLKCNVCGNVFSKPQYLENHMKKHTNEPAHACQICGKSFAMAVRLQYHMRTHSGEKRYICELCGKSFSQKMSFDYHKRWHTGEKPYECDICGKQYRSSGDLSRHKGKHSNKRSHVCEHCGKGFRYSSSLVEHRKGHSNVRSYQCELCLKTFIYRSGLRNHIKESRCSGKSNRTKSVHLERSPEGKNRKETTSQADTSSLFRVTGLSPDAFQNDLASWPFVLRGEDSLGLNEIGFGTFTSALLNIRQGSLN